MVYDFHSEVDFTNNYKEMVNNALNEMLHFDEAE